MPRAVPSATVIFSGVDDKNVNNALKLCGCSVTDAGLLNAETNGSIPGEAREQCRRITERLV